MKYLTQLLDKRVLAPDNTPVGRIVDAVAAVGGRLPALTGVIVKTDRGEVCLPYALLEMAEDPAGPAGTGQIPGDVRLKQPLDAIAPCRPGDEDLRLRRDVLDRQIVDVQDYRVVRVSDVRLAACGEHYCVVGVDASLRATLRRLGGISRPIE
ncbi:MAG TPA: hypothetical protein VKT32_09900, partial [Chthonomonadaceae bacterium]|nr:hypothetical protein [Chthonomonadaceae bacterium]